MHFDCNKFDKKLTGECFAYHLFANIKSTSVKSFRCKLTKTKQIFVTFTEYINRNIFLTKIMNFDLFIEELYARL